ncbi:MAG TPA: DeoR/GlpR family DNA-binding transcription regulator [Hyphomicrobiales bacterium]|nr:DeoR/GlpR family DNA-binding transcription regulator [Hyphomicrobiales bacterium]
MDNDPMTESTTTKRQATMPRPADEQRGALLAEPRRRKILEWLQEEGSARVRDLSEAFAVSEATIRQDLDRLSAGGLIARDHGGAYLKSIPHQVQTMSLHHLTNMDKKRKIGQAAAALVQDHETIILDTGSSTTEVARHLTHRKDLTIITPGLNIALMLGAIQSFTVHMPGGQFKAPTLSVSSEKSAEYFNDIFAGKLFLATAGVSVDAGLTYPSFADLPIKHAMIKAANEVILVADSSKVNNNSFTSLGGVDLVNVFITDGGLSDKDANAFEKAGIRIIIAR